MPKIAMMTEELREAMDILFLEDPYTAKTPATVIARLRDLCGLECEDALAQQMCNDQMDKLLSYRNKRMRNQKERDLRDQTRQRWLTSFIREYIATNMHKPKFYEVNEEAKTYFGSTIEHTRLRPIMDQACFGTTTAQAALPFAPCVPQEEEEKEEQPQQEQPMPTHAVWEQVMAALEAQTKRINEMADKMASLLTQQVAFDNELVQMQKQTGVFKHTLTDVRERLASVEAKSANPSTIPSAANPSLAKALSELAALGLTLKIESRS